MLELIILTQSVQSETRDKSRDSGRHSVSEGRVSVVILPALLPRHLQHINENTIFYQVISIFGLFDFCSMPCTSPTLLNLPQFLLVNY